LSICTESGQDRRGFGPAATTQGNQKMNRYDPSYLSPEKAVAHRGRTYFVSLSSGESSLVQVAKANHAGSTWRQTIKEGSAIWRKAVRLARDAD
jgi:hypothetical protein